MGTMTPSERVKLWRKKNPHYRRKYKRKPRKSLVVKDIYLKELLATGLTVRDFL